MLKITNIPKTIEPVFDKFRNIFTKPSFDSLKQLTSGIINSEKRKTVRGLKRSISGGKSRTAYEYFFHDAKWDEDSVAQLKADYFFEQFGIGAGDKILLEIDDTFQEKKGDKTEGVGKFYDYSEGRYINANNFVTSCLQVGEVHIPHKSRMYLKKEAAEEMGEKFRTKIEIAYEDIIEPLKVPDGARLYNVFDSWWYSSDFINDIKDLSHEAVCRLKSDKKIVVNGKERKVRDFAENLDFDEIVVKVRGKKKKYFASEHIVKIPKLGKVKLVVSKKEGKDPYYLISTDLDLSCKEIIEIYENRWNLETAHQNLSQRLGFKDCQMRAKKAIERFMQITFLAWAIVVIAAAMNKDIRTVMKEMGIGKYLDTAKFAFFIETVVVIQERVGNPKSREELRAKIEDLWS